MTNQNWFVPHKTLLAKLLWLGLLVNYILEILYCLARFIGIRLWFEPLDLTTLEGRAIYQMMWFEFVLALQFFLINLVLWHKKTAIQVKYRVKSRVFFALGIPLLVIVVLMATQILPGEWPGMIIRRLVAFESWVLVFIFTSWCQLAIINPLLYSKNNGQNYGKN